MAYFDCTGMADKELGKSFQRDTIVRIFSMTKPVTTVAAMMLYERGAFQLDDRVISIFLNLPKRSGKEARLKIRKRKARRCLCAT